MATAEETAAIMRESGFAEVVTRDRNAWYAEVSAGEAAAIAGPLREQIIAVSDRATYERWRDGRRALAEATRKGSLRPTHLRSEEHTSELQSLMRISYAVFCLKNTKNHIDQRYFYAHHISTRQY